MSEHSDSESNERINVRLILPNSSTFITTEVSLDDEISVLLDHASDKIPDDVRVRIIFAGQSLDLHKTFRHYAIKDGSTMHLFFTAAQHNEEEAAPAYEGIYRGGIETMLSADADRPAMIQQRLVLMARTGYLTMEQLQILYVNPEALEAPRGYTQPGVPQIRTFLLYSLGASPTDKYINVREMYTEQPRPSEHETYETEFLSNQSFSLMMLEGGFPIFLRAAFTDIAKLDFITLETPFPVVPLRYMQCENLWVRNESPNVTIYTVASANGVLGPGNPVQMARNRVMSNFSRFMTLVTGILVGLLFNLIVLPIAHHKSMPQEFRTGLYLGLGANIVFATFVGIAGAFT